MSSLLRRFRNQDVVDELTKEVDRYRKLYENLTRSVEGLSNGYESLAKQNLRLLELMIELSNKLKKL